MRNFLLIEDSDLLAVTPDFRTSGIPTCLDYKKNAAPGQGKPFLSPERVLT